MHRSALRRKGDNLDQKLTNLQDIFFNFTSAHFTCVKLRFNVSFVFFVQINWAWLYPMDETHAFPIPAYKNF